jgi:hypothetical protein
MGDAEEIDGSEAGPVAAVSLRPVKLHRDMTEAERQQVGAARVGSLFRAFNSELNEVWEDYSAVAFYMPEVVRLIGVGPMPNLRMSRLVSRNHLKELSKNTTQGIASRIVYKTNGRHAFIDGVSLFEHFMSGLTLKVHMDFPGKLKGLTEQSGEPEARRLKLIDIVLDSDDRYEMIQKLVDEKVRGIFYGNPTDLFTKAKINLDFGSHFKDNCQSELAAFSEVTARRNIIIHNQGRVDRKYLSEVKESPLRLGQAVSIDRDYLLRSFLVLKGLAATSAQLVATNVYKEPLRGKAQRIQKLALRNPVV